MGLQLLAYTSNTAIGKYHQFSIMALIYFLGNHLKKVSRVVGIFVFSALQNRKEN